MKVEKKSETWDVGKLIINYDEYVSTRKLCLFQRGWNRKEGIRPHLNDIKRCFSSTISQQAA